MFSRLKSLPAIGPIVELATSSLVSNAFYMMLSQAALAVLGFFFWVIVARYYTEAEVGYSSAIISMLGLAALIGHAGLDTFLVRFLSRSENPARLLNTCLAYSTVATLVASVIVIGVQALGSGEVAFVARQPVFLASFILFSVVGSASGMLGSSYVATRHSLYLVVKSIVLGLTKLALPILFVGYFRSFGIVASWGLGSIVALLFSLTVLIPRAIPGYVLAFETGARLVRRAWAFSGFSYVTNLLGATPKYVMPLIVINVLGPEENGFFYIAWAMASVLYFIPGAVAQSLFAEGSNDRRTLRKNTTRAFQGAFMILLPCMAILVLLGDRLLLAFGESYSDRSIELLRILALAGIPATVERVYFALLRVYGRLRELLLWRTAITVSVLGASFYGVTVAGLTGIGWAILITHGLLVVLILLTRTSVWLRHGH